MSVRRDHDQHQRARELIFQSFGESITREQDAWLAAHLSGCKPCAAEMESVQQSLLDLHSIACSITASASLVRATQFQVRMRARELQQQDDLMKPLWIAAALAFTWAVVSMPFLWEGFEWLGIHNQLPQMVWVTGFLVMCLMPAAAVAVVALAKRHRPQHSQAHAHGVVN